MDVALRCRCGNVEVCLREPPNEVAGQPQSLPRVLQRRQRLGIADLTSALHRVPELVRASEHHASDASAKWRCYECRLCHVDTVYACRVESQRQGVTSPSSSEQIVTEGALVNLEFVDVPLPGEQDGYSPAFKIVLPGAHQSQQRPSTDISKLLGAAGAQGLSLFERLTNEVDNWFAQHLRDLAANDRGVTKEQERSIRKNALRDRDAIFVKICQENGIGGDLASLARVAETLATAITKKDLLADDDMDDDYDFEGKCKDLSEFKERHGHCRVPRGWKENVDLSNWVRNLRRKKIRGTLTSDKIAKLEEMGFVWRKERKDSWEEHFAQLVEFNARFGHCRVSRNWKENVKLGQWVQSLRRLKLSGRLSGDKIARLESIGFEWRLRQKEDGLGQDSRDGEQAEASDDGDSDDGDSDPDDAYSDEDFVETDSSQTKKETLAARWFKDADQALSISKTQPQRKVLAHHFDGVRLDGLVNFKSSMATPITTPATTSKTSTSTATATTTAAMRIKKAKARLPRSPTFSLNDIDEDLYDSYGHGKYYDYEDEDDEEFDAALDDDEEEDDDWADRAKSTSRSKRKRVREKRPKARQRSNSDEQRPTSPPGPKSGVRACVECGATKTPHWRRGPSDKHGDPAFLCNACGLRYYKTLQQKSSTSTKKKKKRLSAKKQKTRRESEAEEEEEEETAPISQEIKKGTTTRSTKKKNKKVTTKPEKSTQKTIVEAVTDSDSESREGLIIDGLTRSHPGEGDKQRSADERALTQEERAEAAEMMVQAAGGENTHVPWLLAFNLQKRKDLVAAAGSDEPTTDANQRDAAAAEAAPAKEEDDEIFDFVE